MVAPKQAEYASSSCEQATVGPDSPGPLMQAVIRIVGSTPPPECEEWLRRAGDRSQPASVRIEAVESLASGCLEHRFSDAVPEDRRRGRRCCRSQRHRAGLTALGDTAMHVMAIVRALSLPGVRQIGCREAR
jgi:hypothetical protein